MVCTALPIIVSPAKVGNGLSISSSRTLNQQKGEYETIAGPIIALDLGQKRVGVALSDPLLVAITRHKPLQRTSWKKLLSDVAQLIQRFDAKTLVIGLPLRLDGSEGAAAREVCRVADKFARSLGLPVYLQDERLTSAEAEERLRQAGYKAHEILQRIDGESAAIILRDFLAGEARILVLPKPI